jgi:hypothetical protein
MLADEKASMFSKAVGALNQCVFAQIDKAPDAVQVINSAMTEDRSTGNTVVVRPTNLSWFASHLESKFATL